MTVSEMFNHLRLTGIHIPGRGGRSYVLSEILPTPNREGYRVMLSHSQTITSTSLSWSEREDRGFWNERHVIDFVESLIRHGARTLDDYIEQQVGIPVEEPRLNFNDLVNRMDVEDAVEVDFDS